MLVKLLKWCSFWSAGYSNFLIALKLLSYSGVYAGDPSKLSMKAAFGKVWQLEQNGGSIIGGTIKAIQGRNRAPKTPRDP